MATRNKGDIQLTAAAKAGISERSGRRIEKGKISQGDKPIRNWRTREDHFKGIWENEVVPMLEQNTGLQPLTLFEHFAGKYPEKFQQSKLRTFQRKVKKWKAPNGSGKEVMFLQEKIPGTNRYLEKIPILAFSLNAVKFLCSP